MDRRVTSIFSILILLAAAGCGGNSTSRVPSTPPGVTVAAAKYLYVANSADATVSGFSILPTGELQPVPGVNAATSLSTPTALAVSSSGKVYVGSSTSKNVITFSADIATGRLSNPVPLPFDLLHNNFTWSNAATLATCGTHLFAFGEGFGPAPGGGTESIGFSGFAYSLNSDGSINPIDWSGFGTFDSLPIVSNGFIDVSCRYVFHANTAANMAEQTTIDTAAHSMHAYPGSAAGIAPVWVAADPNLKFLYVANSGSNNVSAFSIQVDSGVLTPIVGSPFSAGAQPSSVMVAGDWVYVSNAGDNTVSAFTWNQTSGELTPVAGSPFQVGTNPADFMTAETDLSHSPTGKLLYVANQNSNNVSGFVIESNGALRPVAHSPFTVGSGPRGMAVLVGPQ
jgi:6-phosphogluconolactonase